MKPFLRSVGITIIIIKRRDKWERIDAAVDCLRQRYGYMSIRRALLDTDPLLGRINVKDGHTVHPVGFFGG